jgi:hypothetical protein
LLEKFGTHICEPPAKGPLPVKYVATMPPSAGLSNFREAFIDVLSRVVDAMVVVSGRTVWFVVVERTARVERVCAQTLNV